MKKRIKIIIAMLMLFSMILITKSNAAIEIKPIGSTTTPYIHTTQLNAYQLSYDMRNPTSSLGNNTLDPHLQLSKDYGAWAYLGMSAYGTNGQMANISGIYPDNMGAADVVATPNITGVVQSDELVATTVGQNNTAIKYPSSKYLEILSNGNYTADNTKGMALGETKGWYTARNTEYSDTRPIIWRVTASTVGNWACFNYAYQHLGDVNTTWFRPVIWN